MNYESRCIKMLKELGAPLEDWKCIAMIDEKYPTFVCELCGCEKVRYVHKMHHVDFKEDLYVGCICAGVMEGDVLAARERDRKIKNRAKRKKYFPYRKWNLRHDGTHYLEYNGHCISITISRNGRYCATCDKEYTWLYQNKPIMDFKNACYAAFDLADPVEEVLE